MSEYIPCLLWFFLALGSGFMLGRATLVVRTKAIIRKHKLLSRRNRALAVMIAHKQGVEAARRAFRNSLSLSGQ
jgi:hypothetical protein